MNNLTIETWQGLIRGDEVKVTDVPGIFKFVNIEVNPDTEEVLCVTVVGGRKGRSAMRMFTPERIVVPSEKSLQRQRKNRGNAAESEGQ